MGKRKILHGLPWTVLKDWTWSQPNYTLSLDIPKAEIETVVVDPTMFMADINRDNNYYNADAAATKEKLNASKEETVLRLFSTKGNTFIRLP